MQYDDRFFVVELLLFAVERLINVDSCVLLPSGFVLPLAVQGTFVISFRRPIARLMSLRYLGVRIFP